MNRYSVKEVSRISGVTKRTLHYYDKIGLLKPVCRTEAGYRYYGEKELLRLQQILFYKELDFSLQAIHELLDDPDYNLLDALARHKSALEARKDHISTLLGTIDRTIQHLINEKEMNKPEDLYEGLPKEVGTTYREAAIKEYGQDMIDQSEKELVKLGKEGFQQLKEEQAHILQSLFELRDLSPDHEKVQLWIARHYENTRKFWGTFQSDDTQREVYSGLGELFVQDGRYIQINGQSQPEFAIFLQQAISHFSKTNL